MQGIHTQNTYMIHIMHVRHVHTAYIIQLHALSKQKFPTAVWNSIATPTAWTIGCDLFEKPCIYKPSQLSSVQFKGSHGRYYTCCAYTNPFNSVQFNSVVRMGDIIPIKNLKKPIKNLKKPVKNLKKPIKNLKKHIKTLKNL